MSDKYRSLKRKAQKLRAKKKMCLSKKQFETEKDAFQKGQAIYKCKHCGKWHRSGKMAKFIVEITRKKFKNNP